MRARVHTSSSWIGLEIALAIAAALGTISVLLGSPSDSFAWLERKELFALCIGIGAWLPLLARRRGSYVGELGREGRRLVLRTRLRHVSLAPTAVHLATGERGASIIASYDRGGVAAIAVDDVDGARRVVRELHEAGVGEAPDIPLAWSTLGAALRPAASLFALLYDLYWRDLIGGDKAFYGLSALGAGLALLVFHFVRHRGRLTLFERTAECSRPEMGSLRPHFATCVRGGVSDGSKAAPIAAPRPLREHLAAHLRAMARPDAPRGVRIAEGVAEEPAAALARLRGEVAEAGAYRGAGEAARTRLEQVLHSSAPLGERAVALRVLAHGDRDEARRRILESRETPRREAEWLEEVALEPTDEEAAARIAARVPEFEA